MRIELSEKNILFLMIFTLFIVLFVVLIVDINVSLTPYYSIISYISLGVYLIYLFFLFKYQTRCMAVFSWMVLYLSSAIFAAVFIDTMPGFYLYEVAEITKPSSTSLYLFILVFLSVISMNFTFNLTNKRLNDQDFILKINKEAKLILAMLLFVSVITIVLYINKPAFLLGMSKVVYSREILSPVIDKVVRNALIFVPAVGAIAFGYTGKIKLIAKVTLLLYVLSLIWIGHKFGLVFYVCYFSILLLITVSSESKIKKSLFVMSILFLLSIFLVLVSVSISFNFDTSEALNYLVNRVSQQSQLWFSMQKFDYFNSWHINDFLKEIQTVGQMKLSDDLHSEVGIYKIMSLTMPYQDYLTRYENGQNLAFGFYPLINYYFDISLTMIISSFIFCIYGCMISLLVYFLKNGYYFCSVLCTRLVLMMHAVLIQGDIFRLVSADSIICALLMISYFTFSKTFKRNIGPICNV